MPIYVNKIHIYMTIQRVMPFGAGSKVKRKYLVEVV